jgi:hypothetical protein
METSMLGAIWAVFEPYVREIFKRKLDIIEKRNFWKRSSIGRFMSLYESVLNLERASVAVYDEFAELSQSNAVLAKVVVKDRLQRLSKASKEFVECSRAVNSLLSIYDDPLWVHVTGIRHFKGPIWRNFELWLDALPTNADSQGRLTNTIQYSKIVPTRDAIRSLGTALDFPSHDQNELDQDVENIKENVLAKIDFMRIDLLNKAEIQGQLLPLKLTIEEIAKVKKELADFIRESFPIEKIMESN